MNDDEKFALLWIVCLLTSFAFLGVVIWAIITLVGWVVAQ